MLDSIKGVTFLLPWWFPEPLFLGLHLAPHLSKHVCLYMLLHLAVCVVVVVCNVSEREIQVMMTNCTVLDKKCWFWFWLERKWRLIKWRAFWEIHPGWNMSFILTDCFCSFMFCFSCPLQSLSFSKHVLPPPLCCVHGNLASEDDVCLCVQWTQRDLLNLPCYYFLYFRCANGLPKPVNIHLTRSVYVNTLSSKQCHSHVLSRVVLICSQLVLSFFSCPLHTFSLICFMFFHGTSVPHQNFSSHFSVLQFRGILMNGFKYG